MEASASVIAGFRCAPLTRPTAYTATITATAHPKVMTIHPLPSPFDRASSTLATTPSPNKMSMAVPIASAV